jgi:type I restriction enzyme S subunit
MATEFDIVELGEVASVRSGFAFKSSDWAQSGIPVVKIANVKDGRLIMDSCSYVSSEVADSAAEFLLEPGDVLIAMTGYIGDVARVQQSDVPALLNQRVGRFSIRNPQRLDKRYLFYLLRENDVRKVIEGLGYGSAQPNVSPSLIQRILVPLPIVREQRAIASILGALDDKIDLNQKMSATLEAMARALFKSWFVDFDPVRAKAEGRDPGLAPEIAALFPNSFEESELGQVPKGWQVRGLDEIAHFLNGLPLQKYPPVNGRSLPVIKIAQLRAGHTMSADMASADLDPEYIVGDRDVLFSWSGSLECVLWTGGAGALNQHLFKVTSASFPKWFYYLWIHQHLEGFRHIAAGKATTMGHIQRHHLNDAKAVVPSSKVLKSADSVLSSLIERVITARLESRTLAHIRDALLPKLISGEIPVTDNADLLAGMRSANVSGYTSTSPNAKNRRTPR